MGVNRVSRGEEDNNNNNNNNKKTTIIHIHSLATEKKEKDVLHFVPNVCEVDGCRHTANLDFCFLSPLLYFLVYLKKPST